MLLPDTQCYTASFPHMFQAQVEWIARERTLRNIEFVLHLGDVTARNSGLEWSRAQRAMSTLDAANVPYLMVLGNHDYGPTGAGDVRATQFNQYFTQPNAWREGEAENSFRTLEVAGAKWLVLGLEFGPRDEVVAWADEVLTAHADHHAIVVAHAYLYSDDTRYDFQRKRYTQGSPPRAYFTRDPATVSQGVNDGEDLWQKLIRRHANVVMVTGAHVLNDGTGYSTARDDFGGIVHQMMVNYQCGVTPDRQNGGGSFLRLVEVHPEGRSASIRDYSPAYDQWLTDPDRNFEIAFDRDLRSQFGLAANGGWPRVR